MKHWAPCQYDDSMIGKVNADPATDRCTCPPKCPDCIDGTICDYDGLENVCPRCDGSGIWPPEKITFSMPPFPCPNCEHQILIDKMQKDNQGKYEVIRVLDETGREMPERHWQGATEATASRDELIRENRYLWKENARLKAPWWSRWTWRT